VEPEHRDQTHHPAPTLYPIGFAAGVATLLVGLIVSPTVIAPIGGAIAIVFAFLWVRDATHEYRGEPEHVEPEVREAPAPAAPVPADVGEAAMAPPEPGERFPRNRFLEGATLGLGAVIGGVVTIPVIGAAFGPAFGKQGNHHINLGPLDNFPEGSWKIVHFFRDPTEGEVANRTAYIRYNGQLDGEPSFTIISNRCAHLGCPVQPNGPSFSDQTKTLNTGGGQHVTMIGMLPAGGFGCPCHGGQYDTEGNRVAGPPVRALDRYEFAIVNGDLVLGKMFSVAHVDGTGKNAVIHKYGLAGPGEHVDGWEQVFYPLQPPH
jgi:quinol---cytochrome c reductase iron-sulfur subunit, bacillus type